jgi:hypothetical protein
VHYIGQTETVGAKGFKKRTIVIQTIDEKYPQTIPVELHAERTSLADPLQIGEPVNVRADIRGNYWQDGDKYFSSVVAWKIEQHNAPDPGADQAQPTPDSPSTLVDKDDDDPALQCPGDAKDEDNMPF